MIELAIGDKISTLKTKLMYDHRPNLLESNFELSTIQFRDPNCLSLLSTGLWAKNLFIIHFFGLKLKKNRFISLASICTLDIYSCISKVGADANWTNVLRMIKCTDPFGKRVPLHKDFWGGSPLPKATGFCNCVFKTYLNWPDNL